MNRRAVVVAAASVAIATLAVSVGSAETVDASPPVTSEPELPLSTCLDENRSLSALFLVDTSKSLERSDAAAQRVTGLQAAVGALASLRSASETIGDPIDVNLDFLSFGTTTQRTFAGSRDVWAPLEEDESQLIAQLSAYATANQSEDTDYVSALEPWADRTTKPDGVIGALELLEAAPADSCRLLVWFTDGEFDFDFLGEPKTLNWADPTIVIDSREAGIAAEEPGVAALCGPGGLADRLRTGDIANGAGAQVAVVALGIGTEESTFDLVASIAEGGSPSGPCGTEPPRGETFSASTVEDLIIGLRQSVLGPDDGVSAGNIGINSCAPGEACDDVAEIAEFDYPFFLTGGVSSFNLLALAGEPSITARLIAPDGQVVDLDGNIDTVLDNGATLQVAELAGGGGAHQVEATLPPDRPEWIGQWRVRFSTTDPGNADELLNRASIYVFGGELSARLRDDGSFLRRGRTGTFVVELVTSGGVIVTRPDFVSVPELALRVDDELVDVPDQNVDGTWLIEYDVPADLAGDELLLTGAVSGFLQIDPDAPSVKLQEFPEQPVGVIQVRDLPKFPVMDDAVGSFETVDQENLVVESTVLIDATAPESGGCVGLRDLTAPRSDTYLVTPSVAVFDGDTELPVDSECAVQVETGTTTDLRVVVEFDRDDLVDNGGAVAGSLQGKLAFVSTSAIDPTQRGEFTKSFSVATNPQITSIPPSTQELGLAFLIAVLIPLLIMYGLNYYAARIDVGRNAFVEFPVRYENGILRRLGPEGPSAVRVADDELHIVDMPPEGQYRRVDVGGVTFAGHLPLSPIADVSGRASASSASFVVSEQGTTKNGGQGRLGAALSSGDSHAWAFRSARLPVRRDESSDPVDVEPLDGHLTMIVPRRPENAKTYMTSRIHEITSEITDAVGRSSVAPEDPLEGGAAGDGAAGRDEIPPNDDWSGSSPPTAPSDPFGGGSTPKLPSDPFGDTEVAAPPTTPEPKRGRSRRKSKNENAGSGDGAPPQFPPPPEF